MAIHSDGDGKQGTLAGLWLEPTRKRAHARPEALATSLEPRTAELEPRPGSASAPWSRPRPGQRPPPARRGRIPADLWVQGGHRCRPSCGHVYFTLRDGEARLPVVSSSAARRNCCAFQPQDGLAISACAAASPSTSRAASFSSSPRRWNRAAQGLCSFPLEQLKRLFWPKASSTPGASGRCPPSRAGSRHHLHRRSRAPRHHQSYSPPPRPPGSLVYPATVQGPGAPPVTSGIHSSTKSSPRKACANLFFSPPASPLRSISSSLLAAAAPSKISRLQRRSPCPRHRSIQSPGRLGRRPRNRLHHRGLRRRSARSHAFRRRRNRHFRAAPHRGARRRPSTLASAAPFATNSCSRTSASPRSPSPKSKIGYKLSSAAATSASTTSTTASNPPPHAACASPPARLLLSLGLERQNPAAGSPFARRLESAGQALHRLAASIANRTAPVGRAAPASTRSRPSLSSTAATRLSTSKTTANSSQLRRHPAPANPFAPVSPTAPLPPRSSPPAPHDSCLAQRRVAQTGIMETEFRTQLPRSRIPSNERFYVATSRIVAALTTSRVVAARFSCGCVGSSSGACRRAAPPHKQKNPHPAPRHGNGFLNVCGSRIPRSVAMGGFAFLLGAVVFAYPLLRTSRLVRDGETIMMQRSNVFFAVVIALAAIRILAQLHRQVCRR